MRIAIMQPTYLPWLGYFNLMAQADRFVFLDDVQFSKQSWQQRNRIIDNDRLLWLSVPVQSGGRLGQRIDEVEVSDTTPWRRKHMASVSGAFAGAPFGKEVRDLIEGVLGTSETRLCEINVRLIHAIARFSGVTTQCLRASKLGCTGGRSQRLLDMCRALGGTRYLSPAGAKDYILADGVFEEANFAVSFQSFVPGTYRDSPPLHAGEFPSILDALAWLGPEKTRSLIDLEIA
jgi:hypothetical protein